MAHGAGCGGQVDGVAVPAAGILVREAGAIAVIGMGAVVGGIPIAGIVALTAVCPKQSSVECRIAVA